MLLMRKSVPRSVALLLFAAAMLAACHSSEGPAPSRPPELPIEPPPVPVVPAPVAPGFLPPVDVGARVGEPGFRVAKDGTIWVHAPGGLWKSTDNGESFEEVTAALGPGPVFGGDADLAIGRNGSLYYTDLEGLVYISVFRSHDNGVTWQENPFASELPGDDRQWIETGPDASPLSLGAEAIYLVFNHIPTNVFLTKSIDGGATWIGRTVVLTTPQTQFWSMGNLLVDPKDGALHMIYALGNALQPIGDGTVPVDYQLRMSTSTNGGLTWSESIVADTVGNSGEIFPVTARDSEGGLYAAWAVEEGGRDLVQMAWSVDNGASWSPPVTLNDEGTSGVMPWIDVSTPGHAVVAWYQTDQAVLSSVAPGDWFVQMASTTDARNPLARWNEARVWDEPVKSGFICTVGIMCRSGGRELLDFFEVRIGADGYPALVFADAAHGDSTIVYYTRQLTGPRL